MTVLNPPFAARSSRSRSSACCCAAVSVFDEGQSMLATVAIQTPRISRAMAGGFGSGLTLGSLGETHDDERATATTASEANHRRINATPDVIEQNPVAASVGSLIFDFADS